MADWNRFWIELTPHCLRRGRLLDALMRSLFTAVASADSRLRSLVAADRRSRAYGPSASQMETMLDDLLRQLTAGCTWTVSIADTPAILNPRLHRLRESDPLQLTPAPDSTPLRLRAHTTSPRSFTVTIVLHPAGGNPTLDPNLENILRQAIDTHRAAGHQFTLQITYPQNR